MKKIIIVGCPGSGKSTLAKDLKKILHYPILHLDKIYHISNTEHISRSELINKIIEFNDINDTWIIDGNYLSTMELRIQLADTVILYNISTNTCLENVKNRALKYKGINRTDMAEGFEEILDPDFLDYIKNFRNVTLPKIEEILTKYDKQIYVINNYQEKEWFLNNFM